MTEKQQLYKQSLIKHLYFKRELSCAELSSLTEKSLPYAAKALSELMEEGVVIESGHAHSTGGRRPQMYSLKSDVMFVVTVAMDQFITHVGIQDMHHRYVGEVEKLELDLSNQSDALQKLAQFLDSFISKSGIPREKIAGIGIGMPGFVDVTKGINYTFLQAGAESIRPSAAPSQPGTSEHEVGTCRMTRDAKDGVCDRFGRVHEVANLFVADGSVFTQQTDKSPTLTIMALALRQADFIAAQWKRQAL